jgi:hypothetical protein
MGLAIGHLDSGVTLDLACSWEENSISAGGARLLSSVVVVKD